MLRLIHTPGMSMRTNIDIDDKLMRDALEASGIPTKKAAVAEALRLLIEKSAQRRLLEMAGKVDFVEGYDPEDGDDEHAEW
jgi:Arc/MetJ family transcription regulator